MTLKLKLQRKRSMKPKVSFKILFVERKRVPSEEF